MKKVNGRIVEFKVKGQDFPSVVKVEYEVDGKKYEITETVKLIGKAIKFGFLPIGQKKIPKIDCTIGNVVSILYDEKYPEKAHIEGNDGIINV